MTDFILHPTVAARWWQTHLPYASEANQLLSTRLSSRDVRAIAVEGIVFKVLQELADDYRQFQLDPDIKLRLWEDVSRLFNVLEQDGSVMPVGQSILAEPAFLMATRYNVSLDDAMSVVLAEVTGLPLVVADDHLANGLQELARERPLLRALLVGEYLDSANNLISDR